MSKLTSEQLCSIIIEEICSIQHRVVSTYDYEMYCEKPTSSDYLKVYETTIPFLSNYLKEYVHCSILEHRNEKMEYFIPFLNLDRQKEQLSLFQERPLLFLPDIMNYLTKKMEGFLFKYNIGTISSISLSEKGYLNVSLKCHMKTNACTASTNINNAIKQKQLDTLNEFGLSLFDDSITTTKLPFGNSDFPCNAKYIEGTRIVASTENINAIEMILKQLNVKSYQITTETYEPNDTNDDNEVPAISFIDTISFNVFVDTLCDFCSTNDIDHYRYNTIYEMEELYGDCGNKMTESSFHMCENYLAYIKKLLTRRQENKTFSFDALLEICRVFSRVCHYIYFDASEYEFVDQGLVLQEYFSAKEFFEHCQLYSKKSSEFIQDTFSFSSSPLVINKENVSFDVSCDNSSIGLLDNELFPMNTKDLREEFLFLDETYNSIYPCTFVYTEDNVTKFMEFIHKCLPNAKVYNIKAFYVESANVAVISTVQLTFETLKDLYDL